MKTSRGAGFVARALRVPVLLSLLILPHAAALMPRTEATAVCIQQALNEFENGGPCDLGDFACYCAGQHTSQLYADIEESCVNDAQAQASAGSFVTSFCHSVSGGSSVSTTSTTSPKPTNTTTASATSYSHASLPTTSTASTSTSATPSLLPSATRSLPSTTSITSAATSAAATTGSSTTASTPAEASATSASASASPATAETTAPAATSSSATSGGRRDAESVQLGLGVGISMVGALVLGAMLH